MAISSLHIVRGLVDAMDDEPDREGVEPPPLAADGGGDKLMV